MRCALAPLKGRVDGESGFARRANRREFVVKKCRVLGERMDEIGGFWR